MKRYKAHAGENIFDISLKLFGAVDGVWDLMMCNPSLSFNTVIQKDDELLYDEEFVINDDIVKWLEDNGLAVKNGHHSVKLYDVNTMLSDAMESYTNIVSARTALSITTPYERTDLVDNTDGPTILRSSLRASGSVANSRIAYLYNQKTASEIASTNALKAMQKAPDYSKSVSVSEFSVFSKGLNGQKVQTEPVVTGWLKSQPVVLQEADYEDYFNNAKRAKVVVKQFGRYSKIGVQLLSGGLLMVDWGDGSEYSTATYSSSEIVIDHTYADNGYHRMVIYGIMNIKVLDFTEIGGVYYPVHPFAVDEFRTKIDDKTLNKFIYIRKQ